MLRDEREQERKRLEVSAERFLRRVWGWSPEIDDLIAIGMEVVDSVLREEPAVTPGQRQSYVFRRVKCRAIDYMRKMERQDPARLARRLAENGGSLMQRQRPEPMIDLHARVPVELRARLRTAAMASQTTESDLLRRVLADGLREWGNP